MQTSAESATQFAHVFFAFLLDSTKRDFVRGGTSGAQMGARIAGMRFAVIGMLLACATGVQGRPGFVIVTTANDSGPGSLRQALTGAHNGDLIYFTPTLRGQSITL